MIIWGTVVLVYSPIVEPSTGVFLLRATLRMTKSVQSDLGRRTGSKVGTGYWAESVFITCVDFLSSSEK